MTTPHDNLPPGLRARLRELESPVFVPPEVDDRVLHAAGEALTELRRRHRWRLVTHRLAPAAMTAAAAGISLAFLLGIPNGLGERSYERSPSIRDVRDARDVTADGRIDVLDAFAVARALQTDAPHPDWDFDGDGRITAADADAVARHAVRLPDTTTGGGA